MGIVPKDDVRKTEHKHNKARNKVRYAKHVLPSAGAGDGAHSLAGAFGRESVGNTTKTFEHIHRHRRSR